MDLSPLVLYEDNHLIALNKPAGLLSQEDRSGSPDLLSLTREWIRIRDKKPGNAFLGLLHRLDRNVEGVMLFAKTSKAAARISQQIRDRSFHKLYLACLEGDWSDPEGELVDFLIKDEKDRISRVTTRKTPEAREARLGFRRLRKITQGEAIYTLLEVELFTGRFHQIRVQFASRGYPLYGDRRYRARFAPQDRRIGLRSIRLTFRHPTTREEIAIDSPPQEGWPFVSEQPRVVFE